MRSNFSLRGTTSHYLLVARYQDMGQALYRRYRSKRLSEIVGQEHITKTLEEALKQGRISHAYLLTGPRGVGKTSIARIMAHEINGLPYEDDTPHLDIIEIDAASNRRIEEIRELRDKVHVAPTSAKYKVYIIDEVHMLTREAFNALLKTLEEPPAHAVFILATTDAHKVPDTIVSRTQRFTFKPVEKSKVVAHLKDIAQKEKIKLTDEALELLAEHGDGSFRDSISLLDQASSQGQALDLASVQQLLGIPPTEAVQQLHESLKGSDVASLAQQLNGLYDQGYQATTIAKQLARRLRDSVLEGGDTSRELGMLEKLLEVPSAHDPERFLEIVLFQSQTINQPATPVLDKPINVDIDLVVEPVAEEVKVTPAKTEIPDKKTPAKQPVSPVAETSGDAVLDEALWPEVLQALKKRHNTLYGVVRMAQPQFSEGSLNLVFAFAFHQKRISEAGNRQVLSEIIKSLTGSTLSIECSVDKSAKPPKITVHAEKIAAPSNDLKAISNIFGDAELLES